MTSLKLNRKLVLKNRERTPDGAGGFVETWNDLGTMWGEISPRTGRIVTNHGGAGSGCSFKIRVRGAPVGHSNRPVPGQIFQMGARQFRIDAVTEDEPRGLYLTCQTREEVSL